MYRSTIAIIVVVAALTQSAAEAAPTTNPSVERWGVFETALSGPASGNPFTDVQLSARFTHENSAIDVKGFYDGDGVYRIRFMPDATGDWQYVTRSNIARLSGIGDSFICTAPTGNNHGPVRVRYTYHFAYADGRPFVPIGTTCYNWAHESEAVQAQTLATLKSSPFDKVRMMLLPGKKPAALYPYARDAAGHFDPGRFDPVFFHHLEQRIAQLGDEGIQADLILFNPYHKGVMDWFDGLDDAADDRYLEYVVSRLGAYRNIWWSLANEYGQVKHKTDDDWDHFFQIVRENDPYAHLRSIHNAAKFYDSSKSWVTHASIQNGSAVADFGRAVLYRELVQKPVVYDEVCYEGNIDRRWGDLSGEEMVKRFWLGTIAGTYVGHGEVLTDPAGGVAWTSGGGKLLGQSPARIAFLRKILEDGPAEGIDPIDETYETRFGGKAGEFYIVYFGDDTPAEWIFSLPRDPPHKDALNAGMNFHVDILDTWNMTIRPVDRVFTTGMPGDSRYPAVGDAVIKLPGKPYIALRIERVD
jgi:hypothetical protein